MLVVPLFCAPDRRRWEAQDWITYDGERRFHDHAIVVETQSRAQNWKRRRVKGEIWGAYSLFPSKLVAVQHKPGRFRQRSVFGPQPRSIGTASASQSPKPSSSKPLAWIKIFPICLLVLRHKSYVARGRLDSNTSNRCLARFMATSNFSRGTMVSLPSASDRLQSIFKTHSI